MKLWRKVAMKNGKGRGDTIRKMMKQNPGTKIKVTDQGGIQFGGNAVPPLLDSLLVTSGIAKNSESRPETITEALQQIAVKADSEV